MTQNGQRLVVITVITCALVLPLLLAPCYSQVPVWYLFPTPRPHVVDFAADSSGQKLWVVLQDAGLWWSDDGGENWYITPDYWQEIYDGANHSPQSIHVWDAEGMVLTVENAPDLTNNNHWLLSFDGGSSWQNITYGEYEIEQMLNVRNHPEMFFGSGYNSRGITWIVSTADQGTSWTELILANQLRFIKQDDTCDSLYYYNNHNNIYRSDNYLNNCTQFVNFYPMLDEIVPELNRFTAIDLLHLPCGDYLGVIPWAQNIHSEYSYVNYLVRSADDGVTWNIQDDAFSNDLQIVQTMVVSDDENTVILATLKKASGSVHPEKDEYLFRSTDNGYTFTCIDTFVNILPQPLHKNPFSNKVYHFSQYNVLESSDLGETWQEIPLPDIGTQGDFQIAHDQIIHHALYLARPTNLGYTSTCHFSSESWNTVNLQMLALGTDETIYLPSRASGDTLISLWSYLVGDSQCDVQAVHSYDAGQTWFFHGERNYVSSWFLQPHWNANGEILPYILYTSDDNNVHLSLDDGYSWQEIPMPASNYLMTDIVQYEDGLVIAAYGHVYEFDMEEQQWSMLDSTFVDATELWRNPVTGYIYTDQHYWNGNAWISTGNNSFEMIELSGIPGDSPILLAEEEDNPIPWISHDEGIHWFPLESLLPFHDYVNMTSGLTYDPWRERIWMSTEFGLIWIDINDLSPAPETESDDPPIDYSILSVYPNPFNAMARVRMHLEQSGIVHLNVYSITGQLCETLITRHFNAGSHDIVFNASHYSSGSYFLRMETEIQTCTTRMILVK